MTGDFEATVSLGDGADAPGRARRYLHAVLLEQGRHELVDRALLLTSEIVTNAILHGTGTVTMTTRLGRVLRVEVRDGGARMPVLRHPPPQSVTGRGLQLVDHFALRWGHELEPDGKCVWFELDHAETEGKGNRERGAGEAGGGTSPAPEPPAPPAEEEQACA